VTNDSKAIVVDTGRAQMLHPCVGQCEPRESMTVDGRAVVGSGQLVCILQSGPQTDHGDSNSAEKFFAD